MNEKGYTLLDVVIWLAIGTTTTFLIASSVFNYLNIIEVSTHPTTQSNMLIVDRYIMQDIRQNPGGEIVETENGFKISGVKYVEDQCRIKRNQNVLAEGNFENIFVDEDKRKLKFTMNKDDITYTRKFLTY